MIKIYKVISDVFVGFFLGNFVVDEGLCCDGVMFYELYIVWIKVEGFFFKEVWMCCVFYGVFIECGFV